MASRTRARRAESKILGPKAGRGTFGTLDDGDPAFADIVRTYAKRHGDDPGDLVRAEIEQREGMPYGQAIRRRAARQTGGAERTGGTLPAPGSTLTGDASYDDVIERLADRYNDTLPAGDATAPAGASTTSTSSRSSSSGSRSGSSGSSGFGQSGGFVLGVLAYALGLAYLKGGPAGVKAWLRAKFLNQTTVTPRPAPPYMRQGPINPDNPPPGAPPWVYGNTAAGAAGATSNGRQA